MIYLCCFVHSPSGMRRSSGKQALRRQYSGYPSHCAGWSGKQPRCGEKEKSQDRELEPDEQ